MTAGLIIAVVTPVSTKPGAPPSGGLSGDPQRISCAFIGCHTGPENQFTSSDLTINFGDTLTNLTAMNGQTYMPGKDYYIEFNPTLTNGSNTVYGFQMTALDLSGNMAGAFTIVDPVTTSEQSLLGRNYIGHHDASSFNDWIFKWTAPAIDVGNITFYYASNIANGDGSERGDSIYKGTTAITPFVETVGIPRAPEYSTSVQVYPNPSWDYVEVSFNSNKRTQVLLSIFTIDGRVVMPGKEFPVEAGKNVIKYDFENTVSTGDYILELCSSAFPVLHKHIVIRYS